MTRESIRRGAVECWRGLADHPARLVSLGLLVAGLVLVLLGWLGAQDSAYLVEDLAYIGTGGLGGLACLGVAAAVHVAARTTERCDDLDRIDAALRGEG